MRSPYGITKIIIFAVMITELSIDSIESICEYLLPEDIFNLSITCRTLYDQLQTPTIYKLLYLKKFNYSSNQLGDNWIDRFKLRTSPAKLFTWGSTDLGRLGYKISDVPPEKLTPNRNVKFPHNLLNFNNLIITDLKSNGFSFQILTNQGLFFTGNDYKRRGNSSPGPTISDYRKRVELGGPVGVFPPITTVVPIPGIRGGPRPLPGQRINPRMGGTLTGVPHEGPEPSSRVTHPNLTLPPEQIPSLKEFQLSQDKDHGKDHDNPTPEEKWKNIESSFVTRLDTQDAKIISISSGRMHFIGLSDDNNIYSWDTGNSDLKGIKLKFPGIQGDALGGISDLPPILKIKCGWNLSSFYVKGKLIIWYSRNAITEQQVKEGDFTSECNYWIIPDSNHGIIDWYLGPDFIILLQNNGVFGKKINVGHYFHNISGHSVLEDFKPLHRFNYWLKSYNLKGTNVKFSKIVGGFNHFAIFTSDQTVLLGDNSFIDDNIDEDEDNIDPDNLVLPKIVPLDDIIELEIGDYHYLALNSNGEVFSWGINSNHCGCLGIGDVDGELKQPAKLDGKWIVITAAGWHSGGIQSQTS